VKADDAGETWSNPLHAKLTVQGVLDGRAAKEWSITAIVMALYDIGGLL